MEKYELTYLMNPDLDNEHIDSLEETVKNHIQTENGSLNNIPKKPIKKVLGYLIKNNKTAMLSIVNFSLLSNKIEKLKNKLSSEKEILRFILTTKKSSPKLKKIKPLKKKIVFFNAKNKIVPTLRKYPDSKIKPQTEKEKKVELKEIDKKLEEILGKNYKTH